MKLGEPKVWQFWRFFGDFRFIRSSSLPSAVMASVNLSTFAPKPPDLYGGSATGFATSENGLKPLNVTAPAGDSSTPSTLSYARVLASSSMLPQGDLPIPTRPRPRLTPRFSLNSLPGREVGTKDGQPAVSFTSSEIDACEKLFEHSIMAKFTVGRPHLAEIHRTFVSHWHVASRASLSEIWDSRHVLIIFDSEEDVRVALSSPLNKVGHEYF